MARILAKSMFNRIRKPSRVEDFRQVAAFGASNPGRKLVRAVSEVGPMKIEDRHCQDGRTFYMKQGPYRTLTALEIEEMIFIQNKVIFHILSHPHLENTKPNWEVIVTKRNCVYVLVS